MTLKECVFFYDNRMYHVQWDDRIRALNLDKEIKVILHVRKKIKSICFFRFIQYNSDAYSHPYEYTYANHITMSIFED